MLLRQAGPQSMAEVCTTSGTICRNAAGAAVKRVPSRLGAVTCGARASQTLPRVPEQETDVSGRGGQGQVELRGGVERGSGAQRAAGGAGSAPPAAGVG